MDERQRLQYLRAMGLTQWERRLRAPIPEPAPTDAAGSRPAAPRLRVVADLSEAETSGREVLPDRPLEPLGWAELEAAVGACRNCPLCETRTRTVFGAGNRAADLMLVGEAPGADEDRQGEPFVGRAGQLLTRMLEAIGLSREQVFIANLLKCRPPGNRDPRPEEIGACNPYLQRQIELVAPRVILTLGRISAHHLLATDTPVGRLRGRWFSLGEHQTALRVTYHPAYLLRSPEQKARAWEDLQEVARRLG
ncbi:MAG: uracil-DNA glycosylase [Chromatiaceae bacterium]|nr:uracil-DNA glycosylase [Chromatiaceae bacterium]